MTRSWRRVAQGVAFVAVLALVIGFTVASFQQRFTESVPVTLKVERTGTQLEKNADVKVRGLIVGRVSERRTTGSGAELTLALQPDKTRLIPANVSARLLPKTLFGEKYVELVLPERPARAIRAGDVIPEDRSEAAVEVERVLANLFSLLRALEPEKLNHALTAMSTALRGQGEQIGESLEKLDRYLAQIEPELPTFQEDISALADLASTLNESADDLLEAARNSVTTARTLTSKQDVLAQFLRGTAGFSETLTEILDRDGRNLVKLAETSRPILSVVHGRREILAPTITDLRKFATELNDALDTRNALNIRLEVVPNRGFYTSPCRYPHCNSEVEGGSAAPAAPVGSPEEKAVLSELLGPVLRVAPADVPDVADVLFGPVLRGARVAVTP